MNKRIFFDMDGVLANYPKGATLDQMYQKGYYLNLHPEWDVIKLYSDLSNSPNVRLYVLTCYLADSPYALDEKKAWLAKWLPFAEPIYVPCGESKADHVLLHTGVPVSKSDLLIDDFTKNLIDFENSGGTGIKLINGINDTNGTWNGVRIKKENAVCDFYSKVV